MSATTLVIFALVGILFADAKPLPLGRGRNHWEDLSSSEDAVIEMLLSKLGQMQQNEGAPFEDEEKINEENGVANRPDVFGDIVLTPEQLEELKKYNRGEPGSAQAFVTFSQPWPNGILPYTIASTITKPTQKLIQTAMDEIEDNSCIQFVKLDQSNAWQYPNYVEFLVDNGCFSNFGMVGIGKQPISIGRGCEHKVVIQHEILHALGRIHEQSRPDRDDYVTIIEANIIPGKKDQFQPFPSDTQNIEYDYGSVMHYSRDAFSIRPGDPNFDTIVPKQQGVEIGQRQGLSQKDWEHINRRYCEESPSPPGPVNPGPGPVNPGPGPVFPGPGPVFPGPGPVFPGPGPVFPGPGPVFPGPGPVFPGPGPVFPGPGPVFPGPGPVFPGPGPVFPGPGPVFPGPGPLPGPGPVFPGPGPLPGPGPVFPGPGPLPGPGPVFPGPGPVFPGPGPVFPGPGPLPGPGPFPGPGPLPVFPGPGPVFPPFAKEQAGYDE